MLPDPSKHDLPPLSELLPLGYLYLLILGIASQSIFYGLLGVNYLEYADLLDVLISPLALVTGHVVVLAVVVLVPAALYPYLRFVRWLSLRKNPEAANSGLLAQPLGKAWLSLCAGSMLFAFIGMGVGAGMAVKERLDNGESRIDYELTWTDGQVEQIALIRKNISYLFYARPGERSLTITPITDNVRSLRVLGPDERQAIETSNQG
ncbi:hypothetical protein [Wenzhouxiangella marina]|uniref:Uncharacterized protein n=1 Tax=Wenzhouxiangella marina TaxID=1579979 RepID=A0A0K0XZ65_9GAMM|nr:hypothetical protein [Wenzhouxiangella marina]AKS42965.1 hypothetical protein WM2015_2607 [Wenzhouxiangella marina]MBB6087351.1 hypothetical protein [Wenzhouxiangella marina]